MSYRLDYSSVADRLAALYAKPFGGKKTGRYRISARLLREMFGCRRLYEDDVRMLTRALAQQGYILVDMDTFFVVMAANTFVNYRRANEDSLS
ncbi:hypothetical protein AUC69_09070 [Methyloceanibacter superfactus]|uniref:Uncharacterized protein n=1 Tax=Methyloceanibacter superfactus TaxID=1774969 RepID=A0A1E3W1V9_9HYPH|nr:hypothetical protein [Methyloceanibacter superfactus]ODR99794.1 hypothetical protein AUC69_09070 [Methyloceanibacter superfactus]